MRSALDRKLPPPSPCPSRPSESRTRRAPRTQDASNGRAHDARGGDASTGEGADGSVVKLVFHPTGGGGRERVRRGGMGRFNSCVPFDRRRRTGACTKGSGSPTAGTARAGAPLAPCACACRGLGCPWWEGGLPQHTVCMDPRGVSPYQGMYPQPGAGCAPLAGTRAVAPVRSLCGILRQQTAAVALSSVAVGALPSVAVGALLQRVHVPLHGEWRGL